MANEYTFDQIAINSKDKKKPEQSDFPVYLGLENLDAENLHVTRFNEDAMPSGEKIIMRKGDVLFGKRRAYQKKVAIAPFDGIFSAHGMVLRPKTDVVDTGFFPFFISSDYFLDRAISISVGSLSPTVNWGDLKIQKFNLPSLDEQRKLAKVLWKIDGLEHKYRRLIEQCDELIKAQFVEMFGDPSNNSLKLPEIKLEECLYSIENGKSFVCSDIPRRGTFPGVLKLSAVTSGEYHEEENKAVLDINDFIKKSEVHRDDLLFTRKNTPELVGMCAYVKSTEKNLMMPDIIFRLNPKSICNKIYLWKLINHDMFRDKIKNLASGTATSMSNISKERLNSLNIILPPLPLQEEFAAFVEQVNASKDSLQNTLSSLQAVKKSILQSIFA